MRIPRSPIHLVIMLAALATGSKTGPAPDIHFTCARATRTFMEYQPFICAVSGELAVNTQKAVNHRIFCIFLKQTLGVRDQ